MSFANRYQRRKLPAPIPEDVVYRRVLDAIRSINAQPSVRPAGVKSNWPQHLEHHAQAIILAVWKGEARKNKAYRKLRSDDFEQIHFDKPEGNMSDEPRRRDPTSREVSDMLTAGAWFASLQCVRANADEALRCQNFYRARMARTAHIVDQKILTWVALGWSMRAIATHPEIKLDESSLERRLANIRRDLFAIANELVDTVDLDDWREMRRKQAADCDRRGRERLRA